MIAHEISQAQNSKLTIMASTDPITVGQSVTGGPENEGAASQTFTIQVTPVPVPLLAPEPAGNASEPPEGQS